MPLKPTTLGYCVVALALIGVPARVAASPVLDQSNVVLHGGCGSIPGGSAAVGQTYTAGTSGMLSAVSVEVFPNSLASGCEIEPTPSQVYPLDISLMSVDESGSPAVVLATTHVSTNQLGLSDPIAFAAPIPQVAGTKYAITVGAPTAPDDVTPAFWSVGDDTYAGGGDFVIYSASPGDWSGVDGADYAFQTFVTAAEVPEPPTMALTLLGLAGILIRRLL